MKNIYNYSLVLILMASSLFSFGQTKITGSVIDEEFNDAMPFANVLIKGTSTGITTDFDGKFSIDVSPGEYTLVFSFVGYNTKEVSNISVKENEVAVINVSLSSVTLSLEEAVITVSAKKNTDQAL